MKNHILVLSLMLGSVSFAQSAVEVSLKSIMKDMSTKLKTIAAQSTDATKNASSEAIANELAKSVGAAKEVIPSSANDKARQDLYIKMIDGVIASSKQLAQAFHDNDNVKAADILSQLSQAKKDGHAEFKK